MIILLGSACCRAVPVSRLASRCDQTEEERTICSKAHRGNEGGVLYSKRVTARSALLVSIQTKTNVIYIGWAYFASPDSEIVYVYPDFVISTISRVNAMLGTFCK